MYISDRLFSEYSGETLYSVNMTEDEYDLYSEFTERMYGEKAEKIGLGTAALGVGSGIGGYALTKSALNDYAKEVGHKNFKDLQKFAVENPEQYQKIAEDYVKKISSSKNLPKRSVKMAKKVVGGGTAMLAAPVLVAGGLGTYGLSKLSSRKKK